jgi:hypothetical protein
MQFTSIARQRIITAWLRIIILKPPGTTNQATISRLRIMRIWHTRITSTQPNTPSTQRDIISTLTDNKGKAAIRRQLRQAAAKPSTSDARSYLT